MDERLTLAASLYPHCAIGADIGTDHGYLPCRLLLDGVCGRMILSDISAAALHKAETLLTRRGLADRASFVCADGLDALTVPVGCVSITGMGGELIATMLRAGRDKLHGAALVLSAHTDLDMVRTAVEAIGYHFTHESLCRAAGRYYIVWKAEPGACTYTADERILGTDLLLHSGDPLLPGYLAWRIRVTEKKLDGLRSASAPDEEAIARCLHHIAIFKEALIQC